MIKLMKLHVRFCWLKSMLTSAALWVPLVVLGGASQPAASDKSATPGAAASTNEVVIPMSVFVMPSATDEVKDPFFPNTTRFKTVVTTKTNRTPAAVTDLALKGLSGRPEAPLATINDQTFGVGEEHDVRVPMGRIRVRCVEINLNDEFVIIEADGQRRELRFPHRR